MTSPTDPSDRVLIRGLVARGIVGVDPHERVAPQELRIDLELCVDARPAAASDDLADAIDYRAVAEGVRSYVAQARPRLVERLAGDLAELVLAGWPGVLRVHVRVVKPAAIPETAGVGVEIVRSRN